MSIPPTRPKEGFENPTEAYLALLNVMATIPREQRVTKVDLWQYADSAHMGASRGRWAFDITTTTTYSSEADRDATMRIIDREAVTDERNRHAFAAYLARRSNDPGGPDGT